MREKIVAVFGFAVVLGFAGRAEAQALNAEQMSAEARSYYDSELTSSYAFVVFGVVTSVVGGVVRTQDGELAEGFGWSSLIGGGLTALGGAGYGVTVVPRREHFVSLLEKDPQRFKREEAEHIAGTDTRFLLYLSAEIATALTGGGLAVYGFAKEDDLFKGIGAGVALQGVGLLALDVPGALRASSYADQVDRFEPKVSVSVGAGEQPWLATVSQTF